MTAILLLLARAALAAVFGVAAAGKLRDREGARTAVTEFGAPQRFAGALSVAIIAGEVTAAAFLLVTPLARAGAGLGLALLIVFSVAIAVTLARGRAPECHCFGQLHSEPAGAATLVRNGGLGAVGLAVAIGGAGTGVVEALAAFGGSRPAVAAVLGVALLVAGASVALLAGVLAGQRRLVARVHDLQEPPAAAGGDPDPEGLPVGSPAPALALPDTAGAVIDLATLTEEGLPLAVVLTDPRCGPCRALLPAVAGWQRELADRVIVVVISAGTAADVRAEQAEHDLARVLVDEEAHALRLFEARGTPSAVLLAADGTVASAVAGGEEAIRRLVEQAGRPLLPLVRVGRAVTVDALIGASALALLAVAGLLCATALRVVREQGRVLLALDAVEAPGPWPDEPSADVVGRAVGTFDLPRLGGGRMSDADLAGRPTLFVHWSTTCGYCTMIAPELAAVAPALAGRGIDLVLASYGEPEANREVLAEHGLDAEVLLQEASALDCFVGIGTPAAVLVGADARVARGVAVGADEVASLVSDVAA